MSESALSKFLDPDRITQLIIPVKGSPMKLRRVHFDKWYGSKFHMKNANREKNRERRKYARSVKSVNRMGSGGGIIGYLFGEYGLLRRTDYTGWESPTPTPTPIQEATPAPIKKPVEKIVTPTIAETIAEIEAASAEFTKAWTPRADMSAKERADLIGFRYIHGFLPSVEETGKNLAPIMLAERLTLEGSVVTQMILLRETLKDAEAWFIFKNIPYAASDMAFLHEGVNSIYARNK